MYIPIPLISITLPLIIPIILVNLCLHFHDYHIMGHCDKIAVLLLCLLVMLTGREFNTRFRLLQEGHEDINASWSRLMNLKSEEKLAVFISITSGKFHVHLRQAARETWLLPCLHSSQCDYRFFVDCPPSRMTESIIEESNLYQDLVSLLLLFCLSECYKICNCYCCSTSDIS